MLIKKIMQILQINYFKMKYVSDAVLRLHYSINFWEIQKYVNHSDQLRISKNQNIHFD